MSAIRDLVHLANHATYHRGFVSTLLYPERVNGRANDYSAIDTTLALLFSPLAGFQRAPNRLYARIVESCSIQVSKGVLRAAI